jgi:hypothetical protein
MVRSMYWRWSCACAVVIAFTSMATPSATASSDCVSIGSYDARKLLRESALVFAGALVEADPYILTFQPDRVWKGRPTRRVTVYVLGPPFIGSYAFRPRERYLVAARELNKEERTLNGIYDPAAKVFGFERPCGSTWPLSLAAELDTITRPRTRD